MKTLLLSLLTLAHAVLTCHADVGELKLNGFNTSMSATVSFNDGLISETNQMPITQLNVTFTGSDKGQLIYNTFCIDLTHTVSVGQSYAVYPRSDLNSVFSNGARMSYIFAGFGLNDLTDNPIQAAAVQIALWDLSLPHNPTTFGPDAGTNNTYSSGDPGVFAVKLEGNPDATAISSLVNQYLMVSIGSTAEGSWLDATAAGSNVDRGESVMLSTVPEPNSFILLIVAASCFAACSLRIRAMFAHWPQTV
jgi:hypothetical protein